ncbi:hypothetical protein PANT111_40138 [Pantoea brenneri]|uniref:Uncharacterized protein n=1 Tax=Pantoea brenneri TaxID=472694 RepID=A0AAX3JAB7_9GAMM|nr:hypothetical protein PANT111_40138 [Pantoea brenneri]
MATEANVDKPGAGMGIFRPKHNRPSGFAGLNVQLNEFYNPFNGIAKSGAAASSTQRLPFPSLKMLFTSTKCFSGSPRPSHSFHALSGKGSQLRSFSISTTPGVGPLHQGMLANKRPHSVVITPFHKYLSEVETS